MSVTKKWESKAPACNGCGKKDQWEAYVENMRTGKNYFVCSCGSEQDE